MYEFIKRIQNVEIVGVEDSNKSEYSLNVNGIAVFCNARMMVFKFPFTPSWVKWSKFY